MKRDLIIGGLIALSFVLGVSASDSGVVVNKADRQPVGIADCCEGLDMSHFAEVWSAIEDSYLGLNSIDQERAIDAALKGFVSAMGDPHSEYYSEEESEVFLSSLQSELQGIGAELTDENGYLEVVTPLKGSPAEAAGLLTGDIIVAVDGNDVRGEEMMEVISKIRGEKGTRVTLGILKDPEAEYSSKQDIDIRRDTIEVPSIHTEILETEGDTFFYLSVNQFSDDTETEFLEAINEILVAQPDGLIMDLRFNGGGYLTTAIDMLGDILENGSKAVNIVESSEKLENEIYATGQARITEIPLVVLVNQASASASEIVAGAVQDNNRGIVIGSQTYGKGTVQELIPFSDNSTLRLTVSKWLTPSGTDIDKEGIKPDILVEFTEEDLEAGVDIQLEKAKEYLRDLEE